tara:strand:- start:45 stop:152 length:108 start_codon:yes stop_codon:yes gene_type:complete
MKNFLLKNINVDGKENLFVIDGEIEKCMIGIEENI